MRWLHQQAFAGSCQLFFIIFFNENAIKFQFQTSASSLLSVLRVYIEAPDTPRKLNKEAAIKHPLLFTAIPLRVLVAVLFQCMLCRRQSFATSQWNIDTEFVTKMRLHWMLIIATSVAKQLPKAAVWNMWVAVWTHVGWKLKVMSYVTNKLIRLRRL